MTSSNDKEFLDYREKMADIYKKRKAKNPAYSLGAFARDLNIGVSMLSLILRKKRTLSLEKAKEVCLRIGLSEQEHFQFLESVKQVSGKSPNLTQEEKVEDSLPKNIPIESLDFKMTWRHAALRELCQLSSFTDDPQYLSEKLCLPEREALQILSECLRATFISKDFDGRYRASEHLIWGDRGPNENLRNLHKDLLARAIDQVDGPTTERALSASFVTVSESQYHEVRRLVRNFNSELTRAIKTEDADKKDRIICLTTQICTI